MDLLDVVNEALVATNFAPISAIEDTNPTAAGIVGILQGTDGRLGVKGHVLRRGWPFNSEEISISANTDGEVVIPADHLVFQPARPERFQVVGTRVRDLVDRTYAIDPAWLPVKGLAILDLDFVEIPAVVAAWISAEAAYRFARSKFPGTPLVVQLRDDVRKAEAEAINAYPVEVSMPLSADRQAARYGSTVRAAGFGTE